MTPLVRATSAAEADWLTIAPSQAGFTSDLEPLLDKATNEKHVWNLHGIVIVRKGRLVLERYFEDVPAPIGHLLLCEESRGSRRRAHLQAAPFASKMRQPTVEVRLGGDSVTTSRTTRRPAISSRTVSRTPAASGSPPPRTIVRTTRKSGEYRRIRGRTYCPGATIRASIWGIPTYFSQSVNRVRMPLA